MMYNYRSNFLLYSVLLLIIIVICPALGNSSTPAATYTQLAKLVQSDGKSDDRFGTSVAISSDTAVIGAYLDDEGANNEQGSAYVFVRSGTTWAFQAKLVAADGAANDRFGYSVSISGDTIIVGASYDDNGRGAAYIFVRNGSTWTQQAKLTANDGTSGDQFGWSVGINGDTAVIGAHLDTVGSFSTQGTAYVYIRSGTGWTQQQKLSSTDGAASDRFGISVAVYGDTIVIGATGQDIGSKSNQGAAYVFVRNGVVWTQQQKLTAENGAANDSFGNSVAISGETIVIGAYSAIVESNTDRGAAYVFVRNDSTWSQQAKLQANDTPNEIFFAISVALDGNVAVIGSPYTSISGNINRGSAYVFARSGATWTQQSKILADNGVNGDFFGSSVAVNGSTVIAGAPEVEVGSNIDQGAAYLFSITVDVVNRAHFDFDGDGKADIGIFRPAVAEWWYQRSSDGVITAAQFGSPSDIRLTPADYTGDGKTDIAFWRPSDGFWFVIRSEDSSYFAFPFGSNGDVPVPADYDGDSKADAAVYRPSQGVWYIQKSTGGTLIQQFGNETDVPVAADYDGDSKADIAIFRASDNSWWHIRSSDGTFRVYQFASGTDKPVIGDWTGDGKADLAVFRPATGEWFIRRSEDMSYYSVPFGTSGDVPAPGDYDGDGKLDTAVFRPSQQTWYINRSTQGILITQFGLSGDRPLENSFVP